MKRTFALLMALTLCLALLAGCAGGQGSSAAAPAAGANSASTASTAESGSQPAPTGDGAYAGYDLSEPVTLYLYMLGDVPTAMDEVLALANEQYFQPVLNTTIEMIFLAWSDYEVKYPLVLAGGDDVDIIFTSSWAFYEQEAGKGAFLEMTDEFIAQWMPNVNEQQPASSWPQVLTNGGVYAIPRMFAGTQGYKMAGIRDDLREQYDLPELTDWDSLEEYLFTIAENETSLQALAAAGTNIEGMHIYLQSQDVLLTEEPVWYAWQNSGNQEPKPEDLSFLYMTDWYKDFALEMKEWADKGVWSKNVMNNSIPQRDGYEQGTSASMLWNSTIFVAGKELEKNGVGTAGYYDITSDKPVRRSSYSGDCWAITTSSENPERAALALDLMKTNVELVHLLQGGIEGRHYIDQGDGTYLPGPEAESYAFNNWAWALNHPETLILAHDDTTSPQQIAIEGTLEGRVFEPIIDGFRFDVNEVSTEWAVVSSLVEEYRRSFECGAFGEQTEAKIEEFRGKLESAGIEKITEAFRAQYQAFLDEYA